jgi:hypothetical protein
MLGTLPALLACLTLPCAAQSPPSAQAFYAAAIAAMDRVAQPPYVSYTLEGESGNVHIGLQAQNHQVWLLFQHGGGTTTWHIQHRTEDYESQVIDGDGGKRYVSQRAFFDPTWFGAYRALRDGMLGFQNATPPRSSLSITALASPTPAAAVKTIATISVIGPNIYTVEDRGPATCANGDPGHALHLTPRRRDARHQLSDVVVDLNSMRFCTIRFKWSEEVWFNGIVEQHYADVGGYWVINGGVLDGTLRVLGVTTGHFVWTYRLTDTVYPQQIPDAAFVPDPSQ